MVKHYILLAALFVCGIALPTPQDDAPYFDEDMAIFFDHTVTDVEGRIVGGAVAPVGAYPWMVALTTGQGATFFCGGSILNNRHVLTAAHCIESIGSGTVVAPSFRIRVGSNNWSSGGQLLSVNRVTKHDRYSPATLKNDIGTLRTSTAINLNAPNVQRVVIATDNVGANVPCRVAGWGRTTTGGAISHQLLELRTNTLDGNRCRTEMARMAQQLGFRAPAVDPTLEICTFLAANRGTCNGDSGSALVRNSNNQQIGVVSWGLPCAQGAPDILVRVSAFRTWINRNS